MLGRNRINFEFLQNFIILNDRLLFKPIERYFGSPTTSNKATSVGLLGSSTAYGPLGVTSIPYLK